MQATPAPAASPNAPVRPWVRWTRRGALALVGVLLGLASAWAVLRSNTAPGPASGPWHVSLLAGNADADPWTRARVALGGLLALNRSETMYYVATTDSDGRALRTRCAYRVQGKPPAARWWSLTAYGDDFFLLPDPQGRHGLQGQAVELDALGRFTLALGGVAPADPAQRWLPTPGDRGLVLTLRVYQPADVLRQQPQAMDAPRIERAGACP